MSATSLRLITFLVGPLLSACLTAVSLALVAWSPLTMFPDIERACRMTHVAIANCASGALAAGVVTLASFLLVIVVAVWMRRAATLSAPPYLVPSLPKILFLLFCFALVLVHLISRELGPAYASRIEELKHFSNLVSIENVLWPLLIQLLLLERDRCLYSAVVALLMLILTLTIFRTTALTVFAFGFAVPLGCLLWYAHRLPQAGDTTWVVAKRSALVGLVAVALFSDGWRDTQSRTIGSNPISQTATANGPSLELGTIGRFRQRLVYPLYQAAMVAQLSDTLPLPTMLDELKRKLRLSDRPNLNEFTYTLIERGDSEPQGTEIGETTSLYYGEGAAYFGKAGIVWALGAPLLFVFIWLVSMKLRIEASAVLSIALWRSSFAGLITMLPSLFIQLACLFAMTRLGNAINPPSLKAPLLSRITAGLLLIVVMATVAVETWAVVDEPARKQLAEITFAATGGCSFDNNAVAALPDRIARAAVVPGREIRSTLIAYTPDRIELLLPYGGIVQQHLPALIATVSSVARCTGGETPTALLNGMRTASTFGAIPINLAAFGATGITAILLMIIFLRRDYRWQLPMQQNDL
jgi:hypothetical protein